VSLDIERIEINCCRRLQIIKRKDDALGSKNGLLFVAIRTHD